MVDTAFQKKEKLKKAILDHLDKESKEESSNPHHFTLSGISTVVGTSYVRGEIEEALDELSDPKKDAQIIEKKFETKVYLPKSDETFSQKFKEYFKPANISFWGAVTITLIIYYTPFSIFNYPESFKAGFFLGLWIMAIFGKVIGNAVIFYYDKVITYFAKMSKISKRALTCIILGVLFAAGLLVGYEIFISGKTLQDISAIEFIGLLFAGGTFGCLIWNFVFKPNQTRQ